MPVSSHPAEHDPDKLYWFQKEWMKRIPPGRKVDLVIPLLREKGLVPESVSAGQFRAWVGGVIRALGDRFVLGDDVIKYGRFFFTAEFDYDPAAVEKYLRKKGIPEMLFEIGGLLYVTDPYDAPTLESRVYEFAENQGMLPMATIIHPLRVAVTGQMIGPGIWDTLEILGREICRRRIATTLVVQYEDLWDAFDAGDYQRILEINLLTVPWRNPCGRPVDLAPPHCGP